MPAFYAEKPHEIQRKKQVTLYNYAYKCDKSKRERISDILSDIISDNLIYTDNLPDIIAAITARLPPSLRKNCIAESKEKPNENTCIASDCFLGFEAIEAFYSK